MKIRIRDIVFVLVFLLTACSLLRADPEDYFANAEVNNMLRAVLSDDRDAFEVHLKTISDINYVGKGGVTPLYWLAVESGAADIGWAIKAMILAGGNPHFIPKNWNYSALLWPVRRGQVDYVEAMIEAGVSVNHLYSDLGTEPTPIFHAMSSRNPDMLTLLIEAGANFEERNSLKQTPLLFANTNNWELAYILLQNGANYEAKDTWGKTIVWPIENNGYGIEAADIDWRQKVIDFLRSKGVKVTPKR